MVLGKHTKIKIQSEVGIIWLKMGDKISSDIFTIVGKSVSRPSKTASMRIK